MVRSDITTAVTDKTKRTDKLTRIQSLLNIVLRKASRSLTEDGEPLMFDCLKRDESLSIVDGNYFKDISTGAGGDLATFPFVFLYSDPEFRYDTDQGYQLNKRDRDWFDAKYPNLANNNNAKTYPVDFYIGQKKIFFGPKSDGSYTIILPYTFLHPEVSSDSDTIYFPDEFLIPIRDGIIAELYDDFKLYEDANEYNGRFLNGLRSLAILNKRNSSGAIITDYNDL